MKFTVDRATWYRGKGFELSRLLNRDGLRCCIGFVCQQCGVPDEKLLGISAISSLRRRYAIVPDGFGCPEWVEDAYGVNDNSYIDDVSRERQLQKMFKANGHEIEFR